MRKHFDLHVVGLFRLPLSPVIDAILADSEFLNPVFALALLQDFTYQIPKCTLSCNYPSRRVHGGLSVGSWILRVSCT